MKNRVEHAEKVSLIFWMDVLCGALWRLVAQHPRHRRTHIQARTIRPVQTDDIATVLSQHPKSSFVAQNALNQQQHREGDRQAEEKTLGGGKEHVQG
jgi:hypothetical protein